MAFESVPVAGFTDPVVGLNPSLIDNQMVSHHPNEIIRGNDLPRKRLRNKIYVIPMASIEILVSIENCCTDNRDPICLIHEISVDQHFLLKPEYRILGRRKLGIEINIHIFAFNVVECIYSVGCSLDVSDPDE